MTRTRELRQELERLERQQRIWELESALGLTPTSAWDHHSEGAALRRRRDLIRSIASRRKLKWRLAVTVLVCAILSVLWLMTAVTNGMAGTGNAWRSWALFFSAFDLPAVLALWLG